MARRLRQDRSGIAAVEFALVAPMLILLLLGVLEFGRLMWVNSNLQFAAEQATRYAIAHTSASPDDITAQAQSALQGMGVTGVQFDVVNSATSVSVTLTYNFTFVSSGVLPYGPITLTGASTFPKN
jgi:Flp pilus assembly protein TadG